MPMDMGGGMTPPPSPMGGPTPNDAMMPPPTGDEKSYDADFDAGVDTNEEDDPKKFIQQLTGKLSQSLNKYQDSLPEPDVELDKYVASMTIAATTKGLGEKDVNAIYKKLKDGNGGDADENDTSDDSEDSIPASPMGDEPNMQAESLKRKADRIVNEVCREILKCKDDDILDRNNSRTDRKFNPYGIPKQFSKR